MTVKVSDVSVPWVLVSGGTSGIGRILVAKLSKAGIHPAIGYRSDRSAAEALAVECGGEAFPLDLDDADQIDATTSRLATRNVTALIMNAGPAPDIEMFRKVTSASFEKQFRVSVIGNHRLLASAIRNIFRNRKAGIVVGILTRAMGSDVEPPLKYVTAHVAAKYGLLGMLNCAKAEYPWLRVETVSPDFTDTPMLRSFDPRFVEMLRDQGKISSPLAVADAILRKVIG